MESKSNYFIAVYTNECKDYCDEKFFKRLGEIKQDPPYIIDNSTSLEYIDRLKKLAPWGHVKHINVPQEPVISRFQRNVTTSVNYLRDLFLETDKPYFLIIESDVLPPIGLLSIFNKAVANLRNENWGILGGLYYDGFHDYNLRLLNKTHHVLSGCTLYKREVIEKYPFRYDETNLGAFPDALISHDAGKEYSLWNDHDIQCQHLHTKHGTRMSKSL